MKLKTLRSLALIALAALALGTQPVHASYDPPPPEQSTFPAYDHVSLTTVGPGQEAELTLKVWGGDTPEKLIIGVTRPGSLNPLGRGDVYYVLPDGSMQRHNQDSVEIYEDGSASAWLGPQDWDIWVYYTKSTPAGAYTFSHPRYETGVPHDYP